MSTTSSFGGSSHDSVGPSVTPRATGSLRRSTAPPERSAVRKRLWKTRKVSGSRSGQALHTGECELHDGKVAGIAVSVGARVASHAGRGEVLVSQTVKDLVAGSGIEFEDRGERELKGLPSSWRLFAVRT
jgi:class 3 adenylate cyclase